MVSWTPNNFLNFLGFRSLSNIGMLLLSYRFIPMTLAGLCRRPGLGCEWNEACLGRQQGCTSAPHEDDTPMNRCGYRLYISRCSHCPPGAEPRGSVIISSTCSKFSSSQFFVLPTEIALCCLNFLLRPLFFRGSFLLMSHSILVVSCLLLFTFDSLDIAASYSFLLLIFLNLPLREPY